MRGRFARRRGIKGGMFMAIKSSNQITFTEHKKIVEIKEWYLATSENTGITTETTGWTTTIQTMNSTKKYLWNYEEVVYSIGSSDISNPVIIGFYGQGEAGKGINNIVNYYQVTSNLIAPELPGANGDSDWSDDTSVVTRLSPTNKYLWNYEAIIYTDGTSTITDPAIIGVYGDSGTNGADAITFQIYSTHGFAFKDNLQSIELKIAAFEGSSAITGAKYTWEWWSDERNGYVAIDNATNTTLQSFTVESSAIYALASLKCTMQYNGKSYTDYVVLTNEAVIYTPVVKFFGGSNVFQTSEPFIIAYIDLYKNQQIEDTIKTPYYYYHTHNTYDASTGAYAFSHAGVDEQYRVDGTLIYGVYRIINASGNSCAKYKARLCYYSSTEERWKGCSPTQYANKYIYTNDLYDTTYATEEATNILVISREDIPRSRDINFTIYEKSLDGDDDQTYNDGLVVARANTIIIDLNDPIVSATEPSDPKNGQLWLNTGVSPYQLKIYEDSKWVYFAQQNGQTVYTSQPSSYSKGDLWILAQNEVCGTFGEGSMLRATQSSSSYDASHWEDAMKMLTELYDNIEQTFTFNPTNQGGKLPGLTIGQTDNAFYVNIRSDKMSFYDNSEGDNKEVVYISNNSANINRLVVKTSMDVNCNATFDGQVQFEKFVWKVESNGSLSLDIIS